MNYLPENIFDAALIKLREGESIFAITQKYPEHKKELTELLEMAQLAMHIPKLTPPVPQKHFRFINHIQSAPFRFVELFTFMRMAIIPISLVIVLLGGKIVVQATEDSLPGDKLYSLKRATEEARLNLSMSEDAVATIHVELAQKRLAEVKKAIDTQDSTVENAAVAALQEQTDKTFALVPSVAAVRAVADNDSSLLDNLVAINKEQKSVLNAIEDSGENTDVTTVALEATKANDKTIAKLIATVNDQTSADLPNKISITGSISIQKDNLITVEKNTFVIDKETMITGLDRQNITELPDNTAKVTVIGSRSEQGLFAKKITILELKPEPSPSAIPSATPTVKGVTTLKPTPIPTPTPELSAINPNETSGTYIVEPNSQQYAP